MITKIKLSISFVLISIFLFAQNNKEIALQKAKDAITLMDNGKIEESILLLQESQKLDPEDFNYPYEIAYANFLKKDYNKTIEILEKLKDYKNENERRYTLWGNTYDIIGNPTKAIEIYDQGLKKYPNKGLLYLEKGVVYEFQKEYNKAIGTYQKGISVEPNFPSNYYRLSLLYLSSVDKTPGLVYGEIFINLERTTNRTREISKKLYEAYKNSVVFENNEWKELNLCKKTQIPIDETARGKLPFCLMFGSQFSLGLISSNPKEISLNSLSEIRKTFIQNFFNKKDLYQKYPNILFDYHKLMIDNQVFDAYNQYIFQMGAESQFDEWHNKNESDYNKFVEWYTKKENIIDPTKDNYWIFNF